MLGQHTAMADHPDTWARIIEMARAQFPGDEPVAQAFAGDMYNAKETATCAAAQEADDEEQAILGTARGAAQLRAELDSTEVDDDESDDFVDFDESEDAPDPADE
jgi:hypothetical protein